jgi:hypothetical protein
MKIGMLWYDGDSTRDMDEKVELAAAYYRTKYGRKPNLCMVHPETVGETELSPNGKIEVRMNPAVLLDHFWVGIKTDESGEKEAQLKAQPAS